jgi:hypothetical protein
MKHVLALFLLPWVANCFAPMAPTRVGLSRTAPVGVLDVSTLTQKTTRSTTTTELKAAMPDMDVVTLVLGQENYGFAIVCLGEGIWSLVQAPSVGQAVKTLVPAGLAAAILFLVSGPMVTSGDIDQVGTGLLIATGVSIGMGASYVARLLSNFSPSPKENAALGLLVAFAGFFSFSQNLVVDGIITLPSLPTIELPTIDLQLPF